MLALLPKMILSALPAAALSAVTAAIGLRTDGTGAKIHLLAAAFAILAVIAAVVARNSHRARLLERRLGDAESRLYTKQWRRETADGLRIVPKRESNG